MKESSYREVGFRIVDSYRRENGRARETSFQRPSDLVNIFLATEVQLLVQRLGFLYPMVYLRGIIHTWGKLILAQD